MKAQRTRDKATRQPERTIVILIQEPKARKGEKRCWEEKTKTAATDDTEISPGPLQGIVCDKFCVEKQEE